MLMTELQKIFLTSTLTLLGGVLLLVAGEVLKLLVIVPIQKFNEQVQVVLDRVDYYSNRLCNHFSAKPSREELELIRNIKADLRAGATQLSSKYRIISGRKLLVKCRMLPTPDKIQEAYGSLMYLQNSILYKGTVDKHNNTRINAEKITAIQKALGK